MTAVDIDIAAPDKRDAPYWFSAFPFPAHHFTVHAMRGREAISKPYRFDVTVSSNALLGDNFERLSVGHRASLVMRPHGEPRVVTGVVESVRAEGLRVGRQRSQTTFRLVPAAALLRHQIRSRIFQDVSVLQVVDAVLGAAGIRTRWNLRHRHPVRSYVTQYEESDLDFVHRLLAEEGIFYSFGAPAAGVTALLGSIAEVATGAALDVASLIASAAGVAHPVETMVFGDDASVYPTIRMGLEDQVLEDIGDAAIGALGGSSEVAAAVGAGLGMVLRDAPSLSYTTADGLVQGGEDRVTAFVSATRVRSDVAEHREFDPARPDAPLTSRTGDVSSALGDLVSAGAAAGVETVAAVSLGQRDPHSFAASFGGELSQALLSLVADRKLETYEHHGFFLFPDGREIEEKARRIRRRRTRKRVTTRGESGAVFLQAGHRFRLEGHPRVDENREHVVVAVEHRADVGGVALLYENSFECVPASITYAPSLRRRKAVETLLTATVVGPPGEEIHVDAAGRIKVHFHWDRRGAGPSTSCWIRTMQAWSGASFGHQFIPRVGMEVVVAFEGGDSDKPLVLGSVPNATHPTPFLLPAEKTKSGLRTQSVPGGRGFNELMFDDAAGKERVYLRAERDLEEEVRNDHRLHVVRNQTIAVDRDRRDTIGRDATYEVRGKLDETVRGDASIHHIGSRVEVIETNLDQRVTGVRTIRLEGRDELEVRGVAEHVYASDRLERVIGTHTLIVGTHDAPRSMTLRAEGVANLSAEDVIEIASSKGITLRCGTASLRVGPDGIELGGAMVRLSGEKGAFEASKDGVTMTSDKVHAHLADKLLVKTENASLAMGTEVKVDGEKILLNSPERAEEAPPPDPKPPTCVVVKDSEGRPLPHQRFIIELKDGAQRSGVTDKQGKATLHLPSGGRLRLPDLVRAGTGAANATWQPHVVQQGDHVEKLAFLHGTNADDVWNNPKNANLKSRRKSMHQLLPGDVVYLPNAPIDWSPLTEGTTNTYTGNIPKTDVQLVVRNDGGDPLAGARYVVTGVPSADGKGPLEGVTSGAGEIKLSVPVTLREVTVTLPLQRREYRVRLGDLDPHDEPSGARQRLKNLGFLAQTAGPDDDISFSIATYQRFAGIPVSGKLDSPTQAALAEHAAGENDSGGAS